MKKLSVLILSCLSAACMKGYNPTYYFNEVQVVNLSGASIEDVSVSVAGTRKTFNCEKVAKNALCRDYFPRLRYPQLGIELNWTHPDGNRKTATSAPRIPAYYYTAFPLRIVMEISEAGSVNAFYEQEEPGGDGMRIYD